ncbi:BRO-N domain-containing protein [Pseudomonas aeruginosa]|uniref:BRO-N domain-containing protein n=1 Tax=Pseudomonas aeruginosa TaxID=287 RepID=UPI0013CE250E|nr:BRO family protein [Pseudomonas aeruginosa]
MGIELDVLVGHPEHELLFVATQVAGAAGLSHPSQSVAQCRARLKAGFKLQEIYQKCISIDPDTIPPHTRKDLVIFTESEVYAMLLRGNAPASEPFRKWVTEEVLPTIRKTGQYSAAESSDPIAVGIMDELKLLRGELVELKGRTKSPPLTSQGLPKG